MLKTTICLLSLLTFLLIFAACGRDQNIEIQNQEYTSIPAEYDETAEYDLLPTEEPYIILADIPSHNEYIVTLEVDPETRTVQGISRISFTNRSEEALDIIAIRVFLNAFMPDVYPRPYTTDVLWQLNRPGYDRGYMTIEYVSINNETPEHTLDGTLLVLHLTEPLYPEATTHLILQYSAYVPMLGHHIGGNENGMWMAMFLPVLAVYAPPRGWHTDPFFPLGEPFFLEAANYQVAITTPIRYTVVGTGHSTEEIIDDTDTRITRFTASMARDFAFAILSPTYQRTNIEIASGIEINLYYYSPDVGERAEFILETAVRTVEHFEYMVGAYPFGQINIVEAEITQPSVGFSQIIFADTLHLTRGNLVHLSHSLGSQWFSSIVGINPITETWLDMGLTRLVRASGFYDTPELHEHMMEVYNRIAHRTDMFMSDSLWAHDNRELFVDTQGRKAMLMLYQLKQLMGDAYFWEFISTYYQVFSFQIATMQDFITMAEEFYGDSLQAFFYPWLFYGTIPIGSADEWGK